MDWKLKREEIRKREFSTGGLIIVSIMGIIGILTIYFLGVFEVETFGMLYECISKNAAKIIVGLFFFCLSLYCWSLFFLNIIIRPKRDIVYLYKNEKEEVYFIDRKRKRIKCFLDLNNLEPSQYFYVFKTRDYIYEVIGKADGAQNQIEKKRYWSNFYLPFLKMENVVVLPIAYLILFIGLSMIFESKGYNKIIGVMFCAYILYYILYDLIYKIKLNNSKSKEIDDSNFIKIYIILRTFIIVVAICAFLALLLYTFLKLSDTTSKLIFLPFLGCSFCAMIPTVLNILQKTKPQKMFHIGYIIFFLTFWFGCLIYLTVYLIKEKEILFSIFTIPFWIAGFFIIYKDLIKKYIS